MTSSVPVSSATTGVTERSIVAQLALSDVEASDIETDANLRRLQHRLAQQAIEADLLDVAFAVTDSPIGPLLVATTTVGLVRVAFELEGHEHVLEQLGATLGPRVLHAPRRLDPVVRQLDEYFSGRRQRFEVPIDLRLSTGFRRSVLDHLVAIGYGITESYGDVARAVGNPKAVRAVGTACATNPVPVVVPCHRVVRSDGAIGNYLGGTEAKIALLALEAG